MKKIYLISWMAICFLLISFSVINVCAAENYNYASEATVCFLDSKGN